MLNALLKAILDSEFLDEKDKFLLIQLDRFQNELGHVTQEELSQRCRIPKTTVERRLRRMREQGLLDVVREGSHRWVYDLKPLLNLRPDGGTASSTDGILPLHPGGPPLLINTGGESFEDSKLPVGCETLPLHSSQERDMSRVTGPESPLLSSLQEQVRKAKPIRETFGCSSSRARKMRDRHEEKEPADYNAQDLHFKYQEVWNKQDFGCRPKRWTARDFKHAKDLIEEQGGETAVKMVTYSLENWESIARRYGVKGYPTMPVLFGFRGSWVPEAVRGRALASGGAKEFDRSSTEIADNLKF